MDDRRFVDLLAGAATPHTDPAFIDNLVTTISCALAAPDRYELGWPAGTVTIAADDVDWLGTSGRSVGYHRDGAALVPSWYTAWSAPFVHAGLLRMRAAVRAEPPSDAVVVGFVLLGMFRFAVKRLPDGSVAPLASERS